MALDATGRPLDKGVFFAVPHALFRESLPVGGGSGEHVFVAVTARDCDAMEDRLRLVDVGTPLVPCLTELGQWDAIVGRQVNVVSRGDETTWTLIAVKHNESRTDVELHLAYAFGVGTSLPALRKTKIPSELLAHVAGEHEIVALTGTRSSIELWSLPRKGEPRRIGEIARARQRSYFTDVRIVRLRDGFALLWYVYPTGSGSGPVGGLWGRTCSPTFDDLDSPLRLVRDDDASYDAWRAFELGDGSVVLYGTGDDGDPVRQLRWRERRDVANEEAKPFAGRPPLALVPTSEGTIAITAYEDGPRTRVCARLMDI
ncbi:MAG TPA: hypothetical protein VM925_34550 [Labilithrix sp.]|nr:hypothetical protein [Labilithrix sp.]